MDPKPLYCLQCETILKRPDSMPRPDGIPYYYAWRNAEAARILHRVYSTVFTDQVSSLPSAMRESLV
eukprot:9177206-Pyramimonas_sp.AAC.1